MIRFVGAVEEGEVACVAGVEYLGFGFEGTGKQKLLLLLLLLLLHILGNGIIKTDVTLAPFTLYSHPSQHAAAAVVLHVVQRFRKRFSETG